MSDILMNFDESGDAVGAVLNDVVRLSYAVHLMLVFPLQNFPLRLNINEFLFPKKAPLGTDRTRFVAITMPLLVFSSLAAIAFPNIWYIFQFMGSTSATCLAFIFPAAIALRYFLKLKIISAELNIYSECSFYELIHVNIRTLSF